MCMEAILGQRTMTILAIFRSPTLRIGSAASEEVIWKC